MSFEPSHDPSVSSTTALNENCDWFWNPLMLRKKLM